MSSGLVARLVLGQSGRLFAVQRGVGLLLWFRILVFWIGGENDGHFLTSLYGLTSGNALANHSAVAACVDLKSHALKTVDGVAEAVAPDIGHGEYVRLFCLVVAVVSQFGVKGRT